MKKAFAVIIASALALGVMLSGCSVEIRSIDSLMRPPHTAMEAELQKSISALIGDEISYRSPESGEDHSAITIRDINRDGVNEAVVFYVKNDDASTVRMCVLTQSGKDWLLVSDFTGNGNGVLTVNFEDLNDDNDEEILVTWFIFNDKSQKKLSIYAADTQNNSLKVSSCISEPYNLMAVTDAYGDGEKQLLVAYSNITKEIDKNTLKLIGVSKDNEISILNEIILDNRIINLTSISTDLPPGGNPRLYVDAHVSDKSSITQVIEWNAEQRNFVSSINDTNAADLTLRSSNLICKDIDKDGIIEIPVQKPLSESINSDTSLAYLLEWCEIKDSALVPQEYHIVNMLENYTLYFPKEWKNKIFVKSDNSARTWHFVDAEENVFFSISACMFEVWDESNFDNAQMLMIQGETVYFCTVTDVGAENGIVIADLMNYFTVNINSQG